VSSQRVALARALINRPAIVLADEPTGNLDSKSSGIVLDMLRQSNKDLGQTVLMITHNPEAAEYGDRMIHMRDGQIVAPDEDPQWSPHHPPEHLTILIAKVLVESRNLTSGSGQAKGGEMPTPT